MFVLHSENQIKPVSYECKSRWYAWLKWTYKKCVGLQNQGLILQFSDHVQL